MAATYAPSAAHRQNKLIRGPVRCSRAALLRYPQTPSACLTALAAGLPRSAPSQHHDAGDGAGTAHVVREAELRVLHLAAAGLAAELRHALVDHAHAARPDRMPEGLEPAARVHREVALERRAALLDELPALALLAKAQVLEVRYLGPGEAVVYLGEVDVRGRDAGHRVRLPRGGLRRAEAQVVEGGIEVGTAGGDGEARALDQHRRLREAPGQVGAADDRRGRSVRRGAAVEEAERPRDDGRLQHLLLGHLHAQVRSLVARPIPMVLDGNPGERLAPETEGVHVAVGGEREEAGRGVAAREQRMPEAGDAPPAAVFELLGAEHEDDVVHARGDREAAVAEGVRPRRAVVLDPRDGPVVEAERVGERDRRLAAAGAGEVRAQVGGLDLGRLDAGVGVGLEGGVADELLEAPLVAIAELRAADADDRDLVLHPVSRGRAFQK